MQVKQRWTNVSVVTPDGLEERDLLIEGDRFGALIAPDESSGDDWQRVDGEGRILYPGMIDLLQHGMSRHLYSDAEPGAIDDASQFLLAFGMTGFLPSFGCTPRDKIEGLITALSGETLKATGARALGVHSEGPCFVMPGAHNPENIYGPSEELAHAMIAAGDGRLRAVTIAPELPGSEQFIRIMKANGVSIHLGHSNAPPDDVPKYVDWGIDAVTHMYDALPLRQPQGMGLHTFSLTDALLAEPDLALGLVCDGIHTHEKLVALLAQLPRDRVFLETDAMKFAGIDGQEFEFYPGYWVKSERGNAVHDRNGGLCGSSLTPDDAMRNYIRMGNTDIVQAAHATSLVPARVIGMDNELGSIEPDKLADFLVLEPETYEIEATYVSGAERYRRQP